MTFELPRLPVVSICYASEDGRKPAERVAQELTKRFQNEPTPIRATLIMRGITSREELPDDDDAVLVVQTEASAENGLFEPYRDSDDPLINFASTESVARIIRGHDWFGYVDKENEKPPGFDELLAEIKNSIGALQINDLDVALLIHWKNKGFAEKLKNKLTSTGLRAAIFDCSKILIEDDKLAVVENRDEFAGDVNSEAENLEADNLEAENPEPENPESAESPPTATRPPGDLLIAKIIVHIDSREFQDNRHCKATIDLLTRYRNRIIHGALSDVSPPYHVRAVDQIPIWERGLWGRRKERQSAIDSLVQRAQQRIRQLPTVCLSYCREDSAQVFSTKCALELMGCRVFYDLNLEFDESWPKVVRNFIQLSDATVAFCSEAGIESDYFKNESALANRLNKCIGVGLDESFPAFNLGSKNILVLSREEPFRPFSTPIVQLSKNISGLANERKFAFIQVDKDDASAKKCADNLADQLRKVFIVNQNNYLDNHQHEKFEDWFETQLEKAEEIHSIWPDSERSDNDALGKHFVDLPQLVELGEGRKRKVVVYVDSPEEIEELKSDYPSIEFEEKDNLSKQFIPGLIDPYEATTHPTRHVPPVFPKVDIDTSKLEQAIRDVELTANLNADLTANVQEKYPRFKRIRDWLLILFGLIGASSLASLAVMQAQNGTPPNYDELLAEINKSINDSAISQEKSAETLATKVTTSLDRIDQTIKDKQITVVVEGIDEIVQRLDLIDGDVGNIATAADNINQRLMELVVEEKLVVGWLEKIEAKIGVVDLTQIVTVLEKLVASHDMLVVEAKTNNTHLDFIVKNTSILAEIVIELKNIQENCCDDSDPDGKQPGTPPGVTGMTPVERQKASLFYYVLARHTFFCDDLVKTDIFLNRAIKLCNLDARYFYFRGLCKKRQGFEREGASDVVIGVGLQQELRSTRQVNQALQRIQGLERMWLEKIRNDPLQYPVLGEN